MRDPFSALKSALQSVFNLESMRNGKYIYPVQQLKESLDNFRPNNEKDFQEIIKALKASVPYIEKWRLDFNTIRTPIDSLAKNLNLPSINWNSFLHHSNASAKFQFKALNDKYRETELLTWLAAKSGASGKRNNVSTQVRMLLEYREHLGFSQKLNTHLKKDPDFLFQLIMESTKNFKQIAHTRLVLYLTDRQLAEAIIKHIPSLVQEHTDPSVQTINLINKLNQILSHGRSISTLLRNSEAKFILDGSEFLQMYQKSGMGTSPSLSSSSEDESLKPVF
ncbi:hypothetical protein [Legionella sp.]|uniref:hypothetical protein n=1 Tax=Legionella sp. TaxID=459 RepID=UPI003C96901C